MANDMIKMDCFTKIHPDPHRIAKVVYRVSKQDGITAGVFALFAEGKDPKEVPAVMLYYPSEKPENPTEMGEALMHVANLQFDAENEGKKEA